ncbi:SHOCT domain-containing protein [Cytobacillus oceanisediminis]|uniref:Uncharacterized protein n=1 Tax=Cytobacillus oceanisediminis 2691 TaxID=1196031 RepID=A0A160MAP7_9BACI|nr:SHOCT domain-containing protein [Cytobacillus oceanisediminis]AND39563.1 hypothetical protein A361_10600 [Cytobacillus oceanisediminis 2691]
MSDLVLKGKNGTLTVTPSKVILKFGRIFGGGKGEKEIRIKSITGIQVKKPGLTVGFIQFAFSGSSEQKGRKMTDVVKDENTITFDTKKQYEEFLKAKELIESYQDKLESGSSPVSSGADELKKFADLKAAGIITDEEFNAKKKQILGL